MKDQRTFTDNNDRPQIVAANEAHMACLLLLDRSGSMDGEPINNLTEGINKFKKQICEDEETAKKVDFAIVGFNHNPNVIQNFTPIQFLDPVTLSADGGTEMAPAIEMAIEMVRDRSLFYKKSGIQAYKPWIIMISDGYGGNVDEIADRIHRLEENGKLKFISLGVGEYDSKILHQLSGNKVLKLAGMDFSDFFDWANKSMRNISKSSPSENAEIPSTEGNLYVDRDTSDWA